MNVNCRRGLWLIIPFLMSCTEAVPEGGFLSSRFSNPLLEGGVTSVTVPASPGTVNLAGTCDSNSTEIQKSSDGIIWTAVTAGIDFDCSDGNFNIPMTHDTAAGSDLMFGTSVDTQNFYVRTAIVFDGDSFETDPLVIPVTYDTSYLGPSITLGSLPQSLSNNTSMNTSVSSSDAVQYEYVRATAGADCNIQTYGSNFSITSNITDSGMGDADYRLCVRGIDFAGITGPPEVHDFTVDTVPPAFTVSNVPAGLNSISPLAIDVNTDLVNYAYKLGEDSVTDCTNSVGYSSSIADAVDITNNISVDQVYELCVIAEDAAGNWTPYASSQSFTWTYDGSQPSVVLATTASDPVTGFYQVTADFSESVTGLAATDFTSTNSTITLSGSGTSYTLDVNPSADGPVVIGLPAGVATDAAGNTNLVSSPASISRNMLSPTVYFQAASQSANEGDNPDIILEMSGTSASDVVVTLVRSGTAGYQASAGSPDYTDDGISFTISAGSTLHTVNVAVDDDTEGEPAETAIYDIDTVSGGGVTEGAPGTHTLTINANDTPTLQFVSTGSTVAENVVGLTHEIVLQLSNAASEDVTFNLVDDGTGTAADPADYSASFTGSQTIGAGTLLHTVTMGLTNDTDFEGTEDVDFSINTPNGAATLGANITHQVDIIDDEIHGPASQIVYSTGPSSHLAGAEIPVVLEIQDVSGNIVSTGPDSTANVTLSLQGGAGTLGGTFIIPAAAGVADFTGFGANIDLVGSDKVLRATKADTTGGGGTVAVQLDSGLFTITHAAAAQLAFTTQPVNTVAGVDIVPVVEIQDAFGNVVSTGAQSTQNVVLNRNAGPVSTLNGTTTLAAVAGVATWTATESLDFSLIGTGYTLDADITNPSSITATSNTFNITHAAASQLVFTTQPISTIAGVDLVPVVTIQDAFGNTVTSGAQSTQNVVLSQNAGPAATLNGTATLAAIGGVATWTGTESLDFDLVGSGYSLDADITNPGAFTATSNTFNITHAAAAQIAFTTQPITTAAGADLVPVVTIQDIFGNTVTTGTDSTQNVTLSQSAGPATALNGTSTLGAIAGVATWTGAQSLDFELAGAGYVLDADISSPAVSDTSAAFVITHDTPDHLTWSTNPSSGSAGTNLQPVVEIRDIYENLIDSDNSSIITLSLQTDPSAGATLSGDVDLTVSGGVATWAAGQAMFLDLVGTGYVLQASDGTRTANSSAFNVTHAAANNLVWSTQPTTGQAGVSLVPVVEIRDAYNNVVTSDSASVITLSIQTDPSAAATLSGDVDLIVSGGVATWTGTQAMFLDKAVAGYILQASDGTYTANSSSFNITPAAPNKLAFVSEPTGGMVNTNLASFDVQILDFYDNLTTATDTVLLTVSTGPGIISGTNSQPASSGIASFGDIQLDTAGNYQLQAASGGLSSAVTSSFTISAPTFNWTGLGADDNWDTAANWSSSQVPGMGDIAVFDGSCSSCNVVFNTLLTLGGNAPEGIDIQAGYTGTMTQTADIAVGPAGWVQAGGTFIGSTFELVLGGNLSLNGGSFTAPQTMRIRRDISWTAGTFSFSVGTTQIFEGPLATTITGMDAQNLSDVVVNKDAGIDLNSGTTINIDGDFNMQSGILTGGGNVNVYGNVNIAGGSGNINSLTMLGVDVTIGGLVAMPFAQIAFNPINTVTLVNDINMPITGPIYLDSGKLYQDNYSVWVNGGGGITLADTTEWYRGCGLIDGSAGAYATSGTGVMYTGDEVTLSIVGGTAAEGTQIPFEFSVTPQNCENTEFYYSTLDGTAISGMDYAGIAVTAGTIPANMDSIIVNVDTSGYDDALAEGDEYFTMQFEAPLPLGNVTLAAGPFTGTIQDNESPVTINISDVTSVDEGNLASFTISLTGASGFDTIFDYDTGANSGTTQIGDYTPISGTATILAGNTNTMIDVSVLGADGIDPGEYFNLTLSNPSANVSPGDIVGSAFIREATAFPVYRSVGPGSSGPLAMGTTNSMSISGGVATFANDMPLNIGVGDAIVYNAGAEIAFISGRTDAQNFNVQNSLGGIPLDVGAHSSWEIYRAYDSLNNALGSANAGSENPGIPAGLRDFDTFSGSNDLTVHNQIWKVALYADAPDAGAFMIDNWTTTGTNAVHIFAPADITQVGARQAHRGYWDPGASMISHSSGGQPAIHILDSGVHIKGLQIEKVGYNGNEQVVHWNGYSSVGSNNFIGNIVRANSNWAGGSAITAFNPGNPSGLNFVNNIIFVDSSFGGSIGCFIDTSDGAVNVTNNTAHGCTTGYTASGSSTTLFRNNLVTNAITDFTGTYNGSTSNNATNGTTLPPGAAGLSNVIVSYIDSGKYDFRLSFANQTLFGVAISMNNPNDPLGYYDFSDDIAGNNRTATNWDIGASMGSSALDPTGVARFRSVGNWPAALANSTPSLNVTSSVASFAAALPDNIGVGDVIEYSTTNGAYDEVAFIHERINAQVFYIRKADGTAPTDSWGGTFVWNVCRAYLSLADAASGSENSSCLASAAGDNFESWSNGLDLDASGEQYHFALYADGFDQSQAIFDNNGPNNWVTGPNRFVRIFSPSTQLEVGHSQQHNGQYSRSFAGIATNAGTGTSLSSELNYFIIEGIQFVYEGGMTGPDVVTNVFLQPQAIGEVIFENNIITSEVSSSDGNLAVYFEDLSSAGVNFQISNNIFINYRDEQCIEIYDGYASVYNNIFANCASGATGQSIGLRHFSLTSIDLVNNIFYEEMTSSAIDDFSTIPSYAGINNIVFTDSEPICANGGPHSGNQCGMNTIPDFSNPDAFDFRVNTGDTKALAMGADLSALIDFPNDKDIIGLARPNGPWDIGPHQALINSDPRSEALGFRSQNETEYSFEIWGTMRGDLIGFGAQDAQLYTNFCMSPCDINDTMAYTEVAFQNYNMGDGTLSHSYGFGAVSQVENINVRIRHFDPDNEREYFYYYTVPIYPPGVIRISDHDVDFRTISETEIQVDVRYQNDSSSPANIVVHWCNESANPGCEPTSGPFDSTDSGPLGQSLLRVYNSNSFAKVTDLYSDTEYRMKVTVTDFGLGTPFTFEEVVKTAGPGTLILKALEPFDILAGNFNARIHYTDGGTPKTGIDLLYCNRSERQRNGQNCGPESASSLAFNNDFSDFMQMSSNIAHPDSTPIAGDEIELWAFGTDNTDGVANNYLSARFKIDDLNNPNINVHGAEIIDRNNQDFKLEVGYSGDSNYTASVEFHYCVDPVGTCDPTNMNITPLIRGDRDFTGEFFGVGTLTHTLVGRVVVYEPDIPLTTNIDLTYVIGDIPMPDENAVYNLQARAESANVIDLSWQSNFKDIGGFVLAYRQGGIPPDPGCTQASSERVVESENIIGTSYRIMGLTGATEYSIRVCARDLGDPGTVVSGSFGETANSIVTSADEIVPPASPLYVEVNSSGINSININWQGSASHYRVSIVEGLIAPTNCSTGLHMSVDITGNNWSPPNTLNEDTFYSVLVCGYDINTLEESLGTPGIGKTDSYTYYSVTQAVAEEGQNLEFYIVSSKPVEQDTELNFSMSNGIADGTDYSSFGGSITIPMGATITTVPISVTTDDDAIDENTEYMYLTAWLNSPGPSDTMLAPTSQGFITDNDGGNDGPLKGTNGPVSATFADGVNRVIAGNFNLWDSSLNNGTVRTRIDGSEDPLYGTYGGFSGGAAKVLAMAVQADGKIIYGGNFTNYQGMPHNRIVRLNIDGSIDTSFTASIGDGEVKAIHVLKDGNIFVGGSFTSPRNQFAKLDAAGNDTGFILSPGLTGTVGQGVEAIGQDSLNKIIIAGSGDQRLARFDLDGTRIESLDGTSSGVNGPIYDFDIDDNGRICFVGNFSNVQLAVRNSMACVNSDFSSNAFDVNAAGGIYSIDRDPMDDSFIIGGSFSDLSSSGTPYRYLARVDKDGNPDINFDFNNGTGANLFVKDVNVLSDGRILVAGAFKSFNGGNTGGLILLNSDGTLDSGFNAGGIGIEDISSAVGVEVVTVDHIGRIYVGGDFPSYNGSRRNKLAKLDANNNIVATFDPGNGVNGIIYAIDKINGHYIVGGSFSNYNGNPANNLAAVDLNNGSFRNSVSDFVAQTNNTVLDLLVIGSTVYAGGAFTFVNMGTTNDDRSRLAAFDNVGATVVAFDTNSGQAPANRGPDNTVRALEYDGTDLIIGGDFIAYGTGGSRNYIAKTQLADGRPQNAWTASGAANPVSALKVETSSGNYNIFVGGAFAGGILYLDGSTGNLVANFNPLSYNGGVVKAIDLLLDDSPNYQVAVGGNFTDYGGDTAAIGLHSLSFNGTTVSPIGLGTMPIGLDVLSLSYDVSGPYLMIGGSFAPYAPLGGAHYTEY